MVEWLSWLPNNSGFISYNVLETLKDSPSTSPSLKILHQRDHELVGSSEPPPFDKVVGSKRFKSGRAKISKIEKVDNLYKNV